MVYFFILRLAAVGASFFLTLFIAKYLPAESAGLALYFISLVVSASAIGRLGSDVQVVRQISTLLHRGDIDVARQISYQALLATIASSIVVVILVVTIGQSMGWVSDTISVGLLGMAVVSVTILYTSTEILKANLALNASIVLQGVLPPFVIVGFMEIQHYEMLLASVAWGYLIPSVIAAVWLVVSMDGISHPVLRVNKEYVLGTLSYAPKASVAFLVPHLPVLWAGWMYTAIEVEAIAVIVKVSMAIALPVVAINAFFSPTIARLYAEKNAAGLKSIFYKSVIFSSVTGLFVAVLITLSYGHIADYFDIDKEEFFLPYMIVIGAQVANVITGPSSVFSAMMKKDFLLNSSAFALLGVFFIVAYFSLDMGALGVLMAYASALVIENFILAFGVVMELNKLGKQ